MLNGASFSFFSAYSATRSRPDFFSHCQNVANFVYIHVKFPHDQLKYKFIRAGNILRFS